MRARFEGDGKKLGNVKELWHGSSSANLLSILKCGLVVPPANAGHCTGRMWGNGVYTASSSTKALNYSTGFWGQSGTRRTFMFLVDVGLGKTYTPRSGTSWGYKLPRGYDSTWAKKRESGLRHDEFITPRTAQCNLTFLVEFAK
jgi:poly [ADP-ribose] polymerase